MRINGQLRLSPPRLRYPILALARRSQCQMAHSRRNNSRLHTSDCPPRCTRTKMLLLSTLHSPLFAAAAAAAAAAPLPLPLSLCYVYCSTHMYIRHTRTRERRGSLFRLSITKIAAIAAILQTKALWRYPCIFIQGDSKKKKKKEHTCPEKWATWGLLALAHV